MNYCLKNGFTLTDEEQSRMMEQIVSITPNLNSLYTWDDIGTATLMCDIYTDTIRYCPQNGNWYLWDGCWRRQTEDGVISDKLQTLLNLLMIYCANELDEGDENSLSYHKYIKSIRTFARMKAILEVMKTMVRMSISEMDTNPYILNTSHLAYDLKTGEVVHDLRPFNVTKKTPCALPDFTTKTCDRWYKFIDEITSGNIEKAQFLQRALGYSILGVNREECMFIAYGAKTRNGKGTLFSTIAAALGEDYADSAPVDLICENKNGKSTDFNAPQPTLAKLVGTRFVTMSESAKDVRLDAASMKTMTGRDTLVTRNLYESSFSFVPQFTLWLNTNHLPAVTDDTVFSSNRIWVIEFNEHFEGSSQDKDLKDLFSEPESKPTILKWLFDGCYDYIKNGLNPPQCVIDATATYRKLHDRIGNFIEECCDVGETTMTMRGTLYAAYRAWCNKSENKYTPMGSTTFYNEIAMRGFPPKRRSDGWYIEGVKVKSVTENKIKLN